MPTLCFILCAIPMQSNVLTTAPGVPTPSSSLPVSPQHIRPLPTFEESLHLGLPVDWFVLRVKTSREHLALQQLESRGLTYVFLPTTTEYRRYPHWGKPYVITRPIFPGYCFLKFPVVRPYLRSLVESTPGVIGILQISPGDYATVADQAVQDLWRLATSGKPLLPHVFIQPGSRCRVVRGPLTGVEGTLVKYGDEWHVALNIYLLGRACSVVLDREAVEEC